VNIEKGVQPPDRFELNIWGKEFPSLSRWLRLVYAAFPKVESYSVSIDLASIAANSESVQTFTVTGLSVNDVVTVNKPSNTAGLDMVQYWVSAADTLSLKFRNSTGSPIDAAAETYKIISTRL